MTLLFLDWISYISSSRLCSSFWRSRGSITCNFLSSWSLLMDSTKTRPHCSNYCLLLNATFTVVTLSGAVIITKYSPFSRRPRWTWLYLRSTSHLGESSATNSKIKSLEQRRFDKKRCPRYIKRFLLTLIFTVRKDAVFNLGKTSHPVRLSL